MRLSRLVYFSAVRISLCNYICIFNITSFLLVCTFGVYGWDYMYTSLEDVTIFEVQSITNIILLLMFCIAHFRSSSMPKIETLRLLSLSMTIAKILVSDLIYWQMYAHRLVCVCFSQYSYALMTLTWEWIALCRWIVSNKFTRWTYCTFQDFQSSIKQENQGLFKSLWYFFVGGSVLFWIWSQSLEQGHGKPTSHLPELILNNFTTRIGHRVGR